VLGAVHLGHPIVRYLTMVSQGLFLWFGGKRTQNLRYICTDKSKSYLNVIALMSTFRIGGREHEIQSGHITCWAVSVFLVVFCTNGKGSTRFEDEL